MLEGGGFARATEPPKGQVQGHPIARRPTGGQQGIVLEQTGQVAADDGFGEVIDPGLNFFNTGVAERFPGFAHGKDVHRNAAFFEQPDFVGDEGFGDARIPLENHAEAGRISRQRHSPYS